jgi:hypothetical protein
VHRDPPSLAGGTLALADGEQIGATHDRRIRDHTHISVRGLEVAPTTDRLHPGRAEARDGKVREGAQGECRGDIDARVLQEALVGQRPEVLGLEVTGSADMGGGRLEPRADDDDHPEHRRDGGGPCTSLLHPSIPPSMASFDFAHRSGETKYRSRERVETAHPWVR